jgi:hypothetical protein
MMSVMDMNLIMISLLFGSIGMGMCMYGKKAGRMVPMGVGAALMVVPYFITNLILLLIVCCGLTVVPWFTRDS